MKDLQFDLTSLRAAYAADVSPEAVVEEVYRRIEAVADPGIFIHLLPQPEALAIARSLPRRHFENAPLWGIPFAIKDNIDLAGAPTTAACPSYAYIARDHAHCVARLIEAGAIPIGKTNLDQFATGLVGTRSPYPVPRNAIDAQLVPGGSSSGSAVAVAHGLVSFALGTDTAGSGRVPAALNNIVGLKPSIGLISNRGVVPACRTLDTVAIFALNVADAYQALSVAAAFDPQDAFARNLPLHPLAPGTASLRVGVPSPGSREFFGDLLQADAFAAALAIIKSTGCTIAEIDFSPFYEVSRMLYDGPWLAERLVVIEDLLRAKPDALHPVTRDVIERATGISAADAFRSAYRLTEFKRRIGAVLESVDLLCVPTIPRPYTLADLDADPIEPNTRLGTYTNFVNLLDLCGIAVPATARADGWPNSVTLLAPAGQDHVVAGFAAHLHAVTDSACGATGWRLPPLPRTQPKADPHEIELAVVGAHMKGLPLNQDLVRRGARFLRRDRTAPLYRLYALPDGRRPGLVRAQGGAAIELEVWAVPEAEVGSFLRTVSSPLAVGTLTLSDGNAVKGFLCESAAIAGATDITSFGGWRAYLAALEARMSTTEMGAPS